MFFFVCVPCLQNKVDLLQHKIPHSDIKKHFPEFRGDPNSETQIKSFFEELFRKEKKEIFPHFTTVCTVYARLTTFRLFHIYIAQFYKLVRSHEVPTTAAGGCGGRWGDALHPHPHHIPPPPRPCKSCGNLLVCCCILPSYPRRGPFSNPTANTIPWLQPITPFVLWL